MIEAKRVLEVAEFPGRQVSGDTSFTQEEEIVVGKLEMPIVNRELVDSVKPESPAIPQLVFEQRRQQEQPIEQLPQYEQMREPSVTISFQVGQQVKDIAFTKKPLGFDFKRNDPTEVRRIHPGGHAADLGVEKSWVMRSMNGETFGDYKNGAPIRDYDYVLNKLKTEAATLPQMPALTISFQTPQQETKEVTFLKRPLGMDFARKNPTRVRSVLPGSLAADLGVETAWIIKAVNNEDVSENIDVDLLLGKLKAGSVALPQVPSLRITFQVPDRGVVEVNFRKTPLGMDFSRRSPSTIKAVTPGGMASEVGVEIGWKMLTLNDEDVSGNDWDKNFRKLQAESASLPKMPSVKLAFKTNANTKKVLLFYRFPFGMDFARKEPMKVKSVTLGGHANCLGVTPGWSLMTVNDEDVSQFDLDASMLKLHEESAELTRVPSMKIAFEVPGQRGTKALVFMRKPVGIEIGRTKPNVVKGLEKDSHATELGVKLGWNIVSINGEDVRSCDFDEIYGQLCSGSSVLSAVS